VTLAYLTDVYIIPEFEGKGLGTWLIKCANEVLESWPELRRSLLISSDGEEFYAKQLGMKTFEQGKTGTVIMTKKYAGSTMQE